jgi:hypothetical protein
MTKYEKYPNSETDICLVISVILHPIFCIQTYEDKDCWMIEWLLMMNLERLERSK